ncbi:MAG: hypothetical protein WC224_07395 [Sphaerochaetaceae bacterium]
MAYCVKCGVKLEAGSTACVLCNTKVLASKEVIGKIEYPLFVKEKAKGKSFYPYFDKTRKGIIELIIAFMVIAEVTLAITAIALQGAFSPWLAMLAVAAGGLYILVGLTVKPNYPKVASYYLIITALLIIGLSFFIKASLWPQIVLLSLAFYWAVGVFPWLLSKGKRFWSFLVVSFAIALFLVLLDALIDNYLSWSLAIALPTYGVIIVSLAFSAIRIRWGKPSMTDIILSIILSSCWGVVAGDFFHLRSIGSEHFLTWGFSPFIVALLLLIILLLTATVRKVRNFFTTRLT